MSEDDSYEPALPPSMKKERDAAREKQMKESSESCSDDECYGPALPPALRARLGSGRPDSDADSSSQRPGAGHVTEPAAVIGPALPPSASAAPAAAAAGREEQSSSDEEGTYGPALPPGFVRRPAAAPPPRPAVKGPALPPGGLPPPGAGPEDEEEDGDVIGPQPAPAEADLGQYAAAELERRASSMKEKLDARGRPAELVREEWMLELPPERAGEFGLGPRQFRRSAAPERGDTSLWTDTPAEAERRKADGKPSTSPAPVQDLASQRRDQRMAEATEKLQAQKKESLMDLHQKELKRKRKEAQDVPKKRREFDRDRDLGANRFDEAQRATAIKRSRGAADMFSAGAQKFL